MYKATVHWYNDAADKDEVSYVIVCADGWGAAMDKVAIDFEYIDRIEMEQLHVGEHHLVYIPEEYFEAVAEHNCW